MDYMATWAATLTGMVEGKKIEHGRSRRIEIDGGWHAVSKDSACCSGARDTYPFTAIPTVGADRRSGMPTGQRRTNTRIDA